MYFLKDFQMQDKLLTDCQDYQELLALEKKRDVLRDAVFKLSVIGEYLEQGKVNRSVMKTLLEIDPTCLDDSDIAINCFSLEDSSLNYEVSLSAWRNAAKFVVGMLDNLPMKMAALMLGAILFVIASMFGKGRGGSTGGSGGGGGGGSSAGSSRSSSSSTGTFTPNHNPREFSRRFDENLLKQKLDAASDPVKILFEGRMRPATNYRMSPFEKLKRIRAILREIRSLGLEKELEGLINDDLIHLAATTKPETVGLMVACRDISTSRLLKGINSMCTTYTESMALTRMYSSALAKKSSYAQHHQKSEILLSDFIRKFSKADTSDVPDDDLELHWRLKPYTNAFSDRYNLSVYTLSSENRSRYFGANVGYSTYISLANDEGSGRTPLADRYGIRSQILNNLRSKADADFADLIFDMTSRTWVTTKTTEIFGRNLDSFKGKSLGVLSNRIEELRQFFTDSDKEVIGEESLSAPVSLIYAMLGDTNNSRSVNAPSIARSRDPKTILEQYRFLGHHFKTVIGEISDGGQSQRSKYVPVIIKDKQATQQLLRDTLDRAFYRSVQSPDYWNQLELFKEHQDREVNDLIKGISEARKTASRLTEAGRLWHITISGRGVNVSDMNKNDVDSAFVACSVGSSDELLPGTCLGVFNNAKDGRLTVNPRLAMEIEAMRREQVIMEGALETILYKPLKEISDGLMGYHKFLTDLATIFEHRGVNLEKVQAR